MESSVQYVRAEGKPAFHRVDTYRLMAHSKGDDNRSEEEMAPYRARDPLEKILKTRSEDPQIESMVKEIQDRIERAVTVASEADFAEHEFVDVAPSEPRWMVLEFPKDRVVSSVRCALRKALENDPKILLIGEDIESPYGGAFKATEGLSEDYPCRVRNTPISEAAITGVANGLSLVGYKPVVEIMFGDFLALLADQWLNHAAKFAGMYADQVKVPIVIRTPMGGNRGYGPTHSQSIEKMFLGIPGTRVLCLHHRYSPAQLYDRLFEMGDIPTLVVENKILYGQYVHANPPMGYQLLSSAEGPFPIIRLKPDNPADITIVAIGGSGMAAEQAALELFDEDELLADLFFPTQLFPFNTSSLVESLTSTRHLLVVEEGQGFVSMSSEILAQIAEDRAVADTVCARVCALPWVIPSCRPLEEKCLPGVMRIVRKVREILNV